jgi:hypothetical protein
VGQLKVTDFGIARSLSDTHTRLTGLANNTSGTLLYMSPQQLLGDDPAASDDIYAFGATLYELLTGKPPFHTGDVAWQIREAEPKPVNSRLATLGLNPLPAEWEETIQACLAKESQNRPKSAAEVARRLKQTAEGQEQVRRNQTSSDQTGGTADCADAADEKNASSGWETGLAVGETEDAAERRVERQSSPLARPGGRERERVDPGAPSQLDERVKNRSLHRWLPFVAAAVVLGIAGYFLWPRPDNRRGAALTAPFDNPAAGTRQDRAPTASTDSVGRGAALTAPSLNEFSVSVDPPDVGARLWLGPLSDVEVKDGKALLKDLPDGEQELTVQAPGYQPFTTRVTVKDGRGSVEAKLVPVRGAVSVTARPGTQVTAVTNADGRRVWAAYRRAARSTSRICSPWASTHSSLSMPTVRQ